MRKIIIEEIPKALGGGWTCYREGNKHYSGDGDTPDMALEDFELLESEKAAQPAVEAGAEKQCRFVKCDFADRCNAACDWSKENRPAPAVEADAGKVRHPIDKPLPICPTCKRVWMNRTA